MLDNPETMPRQPVCPDELCDGPFRGSVAVAAGLITRDRLAGSAWHRLLPDIYLRAGAMVDHVTWCKAALLIAPPGTVLGFHTALWLYCPILRPKPEAPVDIIVPRARNLYPNAKLRVHRMQLAPGDTGQWCGFPVTTSARTGYDLARTLDVVNAVICLDALRQRRMITTDQIEWYLQRSAPGSQRAARALTLSAPAPSPRWKPAPGWCWYSRACHPQSCSMRSTTGDGSSRVWTWRIRGSGWASNTTGTTTGNATLSSTMPSAPTSCASAVGRSSDSPLMMSSATRVESSSRSAPCSTRHKPNTRQSR